MQTTTKTIKDIEKESDIVALNTKIDYLKALPIQTIGGHSNTHNKSNSKNQNNF